MQYKVCIFTGLLIFNLGLFCGNQQKDVQQEIDNVVTLSDAILEKCKLMQDLYASIKLHSQEIFAKLCIDEREKDNFEQKLAYLLNTIDSVEIGDMQGLLEQELFYVVNTDGRDCACTTEEVAILKTEVLKYLIEGGALKKIADSYFEHMLALGKNELVRKETFKEKLQRINLILGDVCEMLGYTTAIGGVALVVIVLPLIWLKFNVFDM